MLLNKKALRVLLVLLFALAVGGQTADRFLLTGENLQNGKEIELNRPLWKYHAGDDLNWAGVDVDDSDWQVLNPSEINTNNSWRDWDGRGWFRARLEIDRALVGQPLSLTIWQQGASEIYLDGVRLQKFGEIGENFDVEFNPQGVPVPLVFSSAGAHTLAIRYSFLAARNLSSGFGRWLARGHFSPGFYSYLHGAAEAEQTYTARQLELNEYKLFSGILFAFAFLHFLLFVFYRRERANLYYSIFAFCLATGNALSSLSNNSRGSGLAAALIFVSFVIFYSSSFLALLAFLYIAFAEKFSRFFWLLSGYLLLLIASMAIFSRARFTLYVVVGFILLTVADALRLMFKALRRRKDGAWIILVGLGIFTVGVLMLVAREFGMIAWTGILELFRNCALYLAIPVAVSIYLARNFARINRRLETKLIEIEAFSMREIEHEKEKARMQIVEAESERRAQELEEARQLQLSMLPKKLPQLPNLEIAAYMKPATEVGGDYYDFHTDPDGTLTIAVGDATGHGLKVGSVVTATKSLFNAFAGQKDISQILTQTSGALKKMNLRGLFMALAMLKIKDGRLTMSIAGMPSILIYRAAGGQVEEIAIRAMPLGGISKFAYQEVTTNLLAGDCVVIMSDGFPEMFNRQNEILGFAKAGEILPAIANRPAQEIINYLVKTADSWANGRPQDDDMTFVVLKIG